MQDITEYRRTCELIDKLTLQSLHLMEEKLQNTMAVETGMYEGTIHLAKSRYIMGQHSVSRLRLPTEDSEEFSASVVCDREDDSGILQLSRQDNKEAGTVNPIKWFGVLVPQNVHKAQGVFRKALEYVVECANTQLRLAHTLENIQLLKEAKKNFSV